MCLEELVDEHEHDYCDECCWCSCSDSVHCCDKFFEDFYLNFGSS